MAFIRRPSVRSIPSPSFTNSPTHPFYLVHFNPYCSPCVVGVMSETSTSAAATQRVCPLSRCTSTHCKFSPNHPAGCAPPSCTRTCNQYHLFPEQYTPQVDGFCSACSRTMGRRHY
ncbi:hypothetical protein B0H13DRAFT_1954609 [Mycena leptocephala]|nr:hypothetical protein B0H13DRAFT_1954609 [Mycena leptocephala]